MRIGSANNKFLSVEDWNREKVVHTDFAKLKELGYNAMDSNHFCDVNCYLSNVPEEEFEAFLKEEKRLGEENGIWINQVHGSWPVYDEYEDRREKHLDHMRKCIRGAYYVGAEVVVYHPIMPEGWWKESDPEFSFKMNVEKFSELADYAAGYGIKIAVENLPFPPIALAKTENIRKLVDEINKPNVGICLDTGHANVFKSDIGDIVRICGDKLFCLHVHDNKGYHDDSHQVPFLCGIDWHKFMKALKEIDYKGVLSLESYAYGIGRKDMPPHLVDMFLKFEAETAKYLASLMD